MSTHRSVGTWLALGAQLAVAIGSAALALLFAVGMFMGILKGDDFNHWGVGLMGFVPFAWTAWRSGRLLRQVWVGVEKPVFILSPLRRGSAGWIFIVAVVLVLLTSMAMHQFWIVQEKGLASEALNAIRDIRDKEDRFKAAHSRFTDVIADLAPMPLRYFSMKLEALDGDPARGFSITLTRNPSPHSSYGQYSIVFQSGTTPPISCVGGSNPQACTKDLIPRN
jgi:hypothetical protein